MYNMCVHHSSCVWETLHMIFKWKKNCAYAIVVITLQIVGLHLELEGA